MFGCVRAVYNRLEGSIKLFPVRSVGIVKKCDFFLLLLKVQNFSFVT